MNRCIAVVVCVVWFLGVAPLARGSESAAPANGKRALQIEDFDAIVEVGSPRLSPDGKRIAYVAGGRIFLISTAAGPARPVTSAESSASDPQWSDDGQSLYFLSDRSGTRQLWRLPLTLAGEAEQVTSLEFPLRAIRFSPGQTRLLIAHSEVHEAAAEEGISQPWVIDRLQFKEDAGDGYITSDLPSHLYVYDMADKRLRPITSGNYAESEAAWSPDGRSVVFVSNREAEPDADYRADLWRVPADGVSSSPTRLTDDAHTKQAPAWSPDGKLIAYIDAEDGVYGIQHLAVVPAAGGKPEILTTSLDRWVSEFRFSADGRWIYLCYDDAGAVNLARINLQSRKMETLIDGERVVSAFDVDPAGGVVAAINTVNDATDIYALKKGEPRRLTESNAEFFAAVAAGSKEKVAFASADGTRSEAFITTPPDFERGRRYPAVLKIHGGPVGQVAYGYDFGTQFLAANGYVVVEPNPRGSTGHGQDFIRAIYLTWGITDYDDVIAAIDYAVEAGYADPQRLAVTGYSYGGYMTNVVITRTGRFRAAAAGAGHAHIVANYGHDIYQKWYHWELGEPWENPAGYERLSPLLHADRVTTPTIFLGGREDWNVPVLSAELFYQMLRRRGVPTRLVVYPDSHHGGWSDDFNKDYLVRVVAWFDRYAKGQVQETAGRK